MTDHNTQAPRALVVDDDRLVRLIVAQTLLAAGFVVDEGDCGAAALRLVQNVPDVLVIDVNLPDVSGLTVCRAVRISEKTADIGVVFLTGDDDVRTVVTAFAAGADDCLHKPIVGEVFVARVQRAVAHAADRKAARRGQQQHEVIVRFLGDLEAATTSAPVRESANKLRALIDKR